MQQGQIVCDLKATVKNLALVLVGAPLGVVGRGGSLQGSKEQSPRPSAL